MRFIKFEGEIPEPRRERHSIKRYFEGFIKSNVKIATIDTEGHYKSTTVAAQVLGLAARRHGYPVKIIRRGETIYITRTDM